MDWKDLGIRDRARYIRMGVSNGITDLDQIRRSYEEMVSGRGYREGGKIERGKVKEEVRDTRPLRRNAMTRGLLDREGGNVYADGGEEDSKRFSREVLRQMYEEGVLTDMIDGDRLMGRDRLAGNGAYERTVRVNDGLRERYKGLYPDYPLMEERVLGKRKVLRRGVNGGYEEEWERAPHPDRIRRNDSPTREMSEQMEDTIHENYKNAEEFGYLQPNEGYIIPYDIDKEIKTRYGRTTTDILDSLAKYAAVTGLSLEDALGLSGQETHLGAVPDYNVRDLEGLDNELREETRDRNRAIMNMSFARDYGYIPAEYLVRDWRYNLASDPIDRSIPPLRHAFEYFKAGKYNPGDPDHAADVRRVGEELLEDPAVRRWMDTSAFARKALQIGRE